MGDLAELGYTVFRGVAPEPLLHAARNAVEAYAGDRPVAWGIVPLHHDRSLWDLRQHPAIHQVFASVLGTERLWVSMDRAIYRAPDAEVGEVHWDLDPRAVKVPTVQGMVFLTDAPADRAPFECVPSLFADLDRWLAAHPDLVWDAPIDLAGHDVVQVPARAGDLVVWDARLPHRGGPNRAQEPRISVPITMWGVGPEADRVERVRCWRDRRIPRVWRDWPGVTDPEPGPPTPLTALGRKLVGVDPW